MGLIQSVICSLTFCAERVLTWAVCACVLLLLMLIMVIFIIYGISVGYHYGQKEISLWAYTAEKRTWKGYKRSDGGEVGDDEKAALRAGQDGQVPATGAEFDLPGQLANTSPGSKEELKVKTVSPTPPAQDFPLRSTKNIPLWHKYVEMKTERTSTTGSPPSTERPPFNLYKLINRFKRTEDEESTTSKPS